MAFTTIDASVIKAEIASYNASVKAEIAGLETRFYRGLMMCAGLIIAVIGLFIAAGGVALKFFQ